MQKCQNSNATFWVIFKQCAEGQKSHKAQDWQLIVPNRKKKTGVNSHLKKNCNKCSIKPPAASSTASSSSCVVVVTWQSPRSKTFMISTRSINLEEKVLMTPLPHSAWDLNDWKARKIPIWKKKNQFYTKKEKIYATEFRAAICILHKNLHRWVVALVFQMHEEIIELIGLEYGC